MTDHDVFHPGERLAQAYAGVQVTGAPIRDAMPDQHRAFFAQLPILFVALADADGGPVATALTGEPGFVASPDPHTLVVAARPDPDDPAAAGLAAGNAVGLLGINLANRRRNRANGVIAFVSPEGFAVDVQQSFGNCPQYIQTRESTPAVAAASEPERLSGLDAAARAQIGAADTFFVATSSGQRVREAGGLDMSHRGGRPGFVRVDGDTLTIPDFRGNRYFNTLGNLLVDARAGLLFPDFSTGDVLQLQGQVEVDWHPTDAIEGAERVWQVHVEKGWRRRGGLALRWTFGAYAPQLDRTGVWPRSA